MKLLFAAASLIFGAALVPLGASTITKVPSASITVGGNTINTSGLSFSYDPTTDMGSISGNLSGTGWQVSLSVTTQPDPFVIYSLTTDNTTGAPLPFTFTLITPVVLGPYDSLSNQFNGTMTDLTGNGVSLTGIMQLALLNNSGVPAVQLGTFSCVHGAGTIFSVYNCPAGAGFGPVATVVPNQNYTSLGANLVFTLSPNAADSFSGRVDLGTVPEPAIPILLGSGLISLALVRRRLTAR